jgi:hypothetical protein
MVKINKYYSGIFIAIIIIAICSFFINKKSTHWDTTSGKGPIIDERIKSVSTCYRGACAITSYSGEVKLMILHHLDKMKIKDPDLYSSCSSGDYEILNDTLVENNSTCDFNKLKDYKKCTDWEYEVSGSTKSKAQSKLDAWIEKHTKTDPWISGCCSKKTKILELLLGFILAFTLVGFIYCCICSFFSAEDESVNVTCDYFKKPVRKAMFGYVVPPDGTNETKNNGKDGTEFGTF